MAIRDIFSQAVSGPAGRLVESSVRTITSEVIREHDLASAAEVDTLRRTVRELESRLDDMDRRLVALDGRLEGERSKVDQLSKKSLELELKASKMEGATRKAAEEIIVHREEQHHTHEEPAPAEEAPAEEAPAEEAPEAETEERSFLVPPSYPQICRFEGCDKPNRSKGFCSAHYQRWRRGTLDGFVSTDGLVFDGDNTWQIDEKLAGQPAEVRKDGNRYRVYVNEQQVKSQRVS